MNSPITYWGGKKIMARHIVPLIPAHTTYVEPFFGGGAIYFLKTPSEVEVINDTNRFVVNGKTLRYNTPEDFVEDLIRFGILETL
jgi:DNA adenine methylase